MSASKKEWDTGYEWKAVGLLALGFGLVGLDRFMILPMFPTISKELGLSYSHIGLVTGALSIGWAISAVFVGRLADVVGRRRVVLAAICLFSVLVGISGLATGLLSLIFLRLLMGFADGAYTPPSIVATIEASKPSRHGLNVGIQQMMMPLFGLALAPIIVTQLLEYINWRWVFALITPVGLLTAVLLYFVLRDQRDMPSVEHTAVHDTRPHKWADVLKYRNVVHNMIGMLCWLTCATVTAALMPHYLMDYRHLDLGQMGLVMSAIGFGGSAGALLVPWLSDSLGRKPTMLLSIVGAAMALIAFMFSGVNTQALFVTLLVTNFFIFPLIILTVGAISTESVPSTLMTSASGLVIFTGEIFGGGIAPVIAGAVAENLGIQYIAHLGLLSLVAGFVNSCFLQETAPKRLARLAGASLSLQNGN